MFLKLVERVLKKRLANSPTIPESIQEAASNHLGKASKIDTAVDAILVDDFRELAIADRERVAEYADARVPGLAQAANRKPRGKQMGGDFIICDDYRKGAGTIPAVVVGMVAAAALGVGGWVFTMDRPEPPAVPPPEAETSVDADTQYEARIEVK